VLNFLYDEEVSGGTGSGVEGSGTVRVIEWGRETFAHPSEVERVLRLKLISLETLRAMCLEDCPAAAGSDGYSGGRYSMASLVAWLGYDSLLPSAQRHQSEESPRESGNTSTLATDGNTGDRDTISSSGIIDSRWFGSGSSGELGVSLSGSRSMMALKRATSAGAGAVLGALGLASHRTNTSVFGGETAAGAADNRASSSSSAAAASGRSRTGGGSGADNARLVLVLWDGGYFVFLASLERAIEEVNSWMAVETNMPDSLH
jgi:hypothetical protein